MATTFDITTYPLETSTRLKRGLGTKVDRMSDGSVRSRVMTTNYPVDIQCTFTPQFETEAAAFISYLTTNAATEFDITHNGITYRGFIDGETVEANITDGVIHWWSFTFIGNAV